MTGSPAPGPQLVDAQDAPGPAVLASRLRAAGLPDRAPTVVLVGGAGGLDRRWAQASERLFAAALVPTLEELGAVLVDGGTDAGVMALAGRARHRAGARGPHVGVVAAGTVAWPGGPAGPDLAELEPNHSHVVLVPGHRWGDESPWLSAVAGAVAGPAPSVTVLANGGSVAYRDVETSLAAGRPVLVLGGTGRTAADIATARSDAAPDPRAGAVADSTLVRTLPDDPAAFRDALRAVLSG